MGVFARLLRRSKATEEASTAEAQAATQTADTGAGVAEETKGPSEGSANSEGSGEPEGPESPERSLGEGGAAMEAAEAAATEDVEIPQQQTAEKAADNEADEGAHT
ncbi:hypothetical protein OG762_32950 [Streptomyces sp. NBC_01136]|nr:hypothetical protein OG762_32950 [Streptomyces sp. NBC_01136]